MPLTDAQLQEYANLMADMGLGGQGRLFRSLASRDCLNQDEWQQEFDRVLALYRSNAGIQRCIRSRVHRHYMSCAQEAQWFTGQRL